jgi:hypothetical protein
MDVYGAGIPTGRDGAIQLPRSASRRSVDPPCRGGDVGSYLWDMASHVPTIDGSWSMDRRDIARRSIPCSGPPLGGVYPRQWVTRSIRIETRCAKQRACPVDLYDCSHSGCQSAADQMKRRDLRHLQPMVPPLVAGGRYIFDRSTSSFHRSSTLDWIWRRSASVR